MKAVLLIVGVLVLAGVVVVLGSSRGEPAPAPPTSASVSPAEAEVNRLVEEDALDGEISPETRAAQQEVEEEAPTNVDTPEERPLVSELAESPDGALREYVRYYANWTSETVAERRRTLVDISVERAQQQARREAERIAEDYELRSARTANSARLEAIIPRGGSPARQSYIVVTEERATAGGQRSAPVLRVYRAVVRRVEGRYAVATWRPQT